MLHDDQLVVERKIDARRLLAIAQRGVEEIEVLAGHHRNPMKRRTKYTASASTAIFRTT